MSEKSKELLAGAKELENYLSQKLQSTVRVDLLHHPSTLKQAKEGTFDLVFLGPEYLSEFLLHTQSEVLLASRRGETSLARSIWLCRKDRNYVDVEELRGKAVSLATRSSLHGYLFPVWDLAKRKKIGPTSSLSDFFSLTVIDRSDLAAVDKLLKGEVEAAAVNEEILAGTLLSETRKDMLKVIQHQGPYTDKLLCIRKGISTTDRKFIRLALLNLNKERPELSNQIFKGDLLDSENLGYLKTVFEALDSERSIKP